MAMKCTSGGCAAKMAAGNLEKILQHLPKKEDPHLLVGFASHDDGAVYQLDEKTGIVSTLDFFPPMVDDPYLFGQIAAANAVSDVYAMGGRVLSALNIVCFPEEEDLGILAEILKGASDKILEAGGVIAGGHSILDPQIKFGLSVTGLVDPEKIWRNNTPQPGDVLILTKKLGTGLVMAARRMQDDQGQDYEEACRSMTMLNKKTAEILHSYDVHALSDVTGFGLIGHLLEMTGERCTAQIDGSRIPCFAGVPYYIDEFYLSAAAQRNRNAASGKVVFEEEDFVLEEILYDPQTSGGFLISLPPSQKERLLEELEQAGIPACEIGRMEEKGDCSIAVRKG